MDVLLPFASLPLIPLDPPSSPPPACFSFAYFIVKPGYRSTQWRRNRTTRTGKGRGGREIARR